MIQIGRYEELGSGVLRVNQACPTDDDLLDIEPDDYELVQAMLCYQSYGGCDDTDPEVHPYHPEICYAGKDNDCDGAVDKQDCFAGPICPKMVSEAQADPAGAGGIWWIAGSR